MAFRVRRGISTDARQTNPCSNLRGGLWFSPDDCLLVHGGNNDAQLSVYNLRSGARSVAIERPAGEGIVTSELSPDGNRIAVAATDGLVMYVPPQASSVQQPKPDRAGSSAYAHLEAGKWQEEWHQGSGTVYCDVAFSGDGNVVASIVDMSGEVEVRRVDGSMLHIVRDFPAGFRSGFTNGLAFSHNFLALGGRERRENQSTVRLLPIHGIQDTDDWRPAFRDLQLEGAFSQVTFSLDGKMLAVAVHRPANVYLYHSESGELDQNSAIIRRQVNQNVIRSPNQIYASSVAFSPNGRFLCSGFLPWNSFVLFDVETLRCVRIISAPRSEARVCAFSHDGNLLATGGELEPVSLNELVPIRPLATYSIAETDSIKIAETDSILEGEQPVETSEQAPSLTGACATSTVVAIACHKRLHIIYHQSSTTFNNVNIETEHEITARWYPMALQPKGGKQIACCFEHSKQVSLRSTIDGRELHRLGGENIFEGFFSGVKYSPDGK
eukprot:COSAG01_NODE_134_length_24525_cov_434.185172_17_plen_497_part_00